MADLIGQRFGKLVVTGPSFHKGSYKFYAPCKCDCGNTLDVVADNLISGNTSSCGCSRITDRVGQRFGQLTVLKLDHTDSKGAWWLCRCDCGNEKVIRANSLVTGDAKTCGHRIDLTGHRFGKLLVLGKDNSPSKTKTKRVRWICLCECGNSISVSSDNLKSGNTTSCGCKKFTVCVTHGMTDTPTYKAWDGMIQRCTNTNSPSYKDYGGRGVTVCERWLTFINFLEDMGVKPDGLEIDRIDNGRGYYKENCRWTDRTTNNRNTRFNRMVAFNGEVKCISEWAEVTGINAGTLIFRLNSGWSPEKTFTTPTKTQYRSKNIKEK